MAVEFTARSREQLGRHEYVQPRVADVLGGNRAVVRFVRFAVLGLESLRGRLEGMAPVSERPNERAHVKEVAAERVRGIGPAVWRVLGDSVNYVRTASTAKAD